MTPSPTGGCVAAAMTPQGRAAIAVVRVSGPGALGAVDQQLAAANGRRLAGQPAGAIRLGRWGGPRGEDVVFCRLDGAGAATEEVEIHCHGGRAAVARVLADLRAAGCESISWREFLNRSALGPIAAEAQAALADAATERAAAVLLDQRDGALERGVRSVLAALAANRTRDAESLLGQLRDACRLGERLASPWRVTIVGRPNVGKSHLLNALLGYQRAIVYDRPGTTRDVVTATTAIDGWPVLLADTAGLRSTADGLEATGVAKARETLRRADLLLVAAEAGPDADTQWRAIESTLPPGCRRRRVATKIDLHPDFPAAEWGSPTSAATGEGVERLLAAIGELLVPSPPRPGAPVPFTERHALLLAAAAEAVRGGEADRARDELLSLLG